MAKNSNAFMKKVQGLSKDQQRQFSEFIKTFSESGEQRTFADDIEFEKDGPDILVSDPEDDSITKISEGEDTLDFEDMTPDEDETEEVIEVAPGEEVEIVIKGEDKAMSKVYSDMIKVFSKLTRSQKRELISGMSHRVFSTDSGAKKISGLDKDVLDKTQKVQNKLSEHRTNDLTKTKNDDPKVEGQDDTPKTTKAVISPNSKVFAFQPIDLILKPLKKLGVSKDKLDKIKSILGDVGEQIDKSKGLKSDKTFSRKQILTARLYAHKGRGMEPFDLIAGVLKRLGISKDKIEKIRGVLSDVGEQIDKSKGLKSDKTFNEDDNESEDRYVVCDEDCTEVFGEDLSLEEAASEMKNHPGSIMMCQCDFDKEEDEELDEEDKEFSSGASSKDVRESTEPTPDDLDDALKGEGTAHGGGNSSRLPKPQIEGEGMEPKINPSSEVKGSKVFSETNIKPGFFNLDKILKGK